MAERGSTVYASYIGEQLAEQDTRKQSIEQRGVAVITTSGTLVSLLFGLGAVLTGVDEYELPHGAEPWLYASMIAFVLAAVGGIVTNLPLLYIGVSPDDLKDAVENLWDDAPNIAEQRIAATQVKVLAKARTLNDLKGYFLLAAVGAEVVAVAFLASALSVILTAG